MSFPVSNQAGISIHAPTRGATTNGAQKRLRRMYFNPRSHEGSDGDATFTELPTGDFNPRSHEGSDGNLYNGVLRIIDFNPRSHEGSDD